MQSCKENSGKVLGLFLFITLISTHPFMPYKESMFAGPHLCIVIHSNTWCLLEWYYRDKTCSLSWGVQQTSSHHWPHIGAYWTIVGRFILDTMTQLLFLTFHKVDFNFTASSFFSYNNNSVNIFGCTEHVNKMIICTCCRSAFNYRRRQAHFISKTVDACHQ